LNLPGKPALAVLLIGLVLLLNAMATTPALHALVHNDAAQAGHQCAVTLFAQGKIDAVAPVVFVSVPAEAIGTTSDWVSSFPWTTVEFLPPGRAPPAVPSPQA
jgi:hypothetical protein